MFLETPVFREALCKILAVNFYGNPRTFEIAFTVLNKK